jgi:hypothetical protein
VLSPDFIRLMMLFSKTNDKVLKEFYLRKWVENPTGG